TRSASAITAAAPSPRPGTTMRCTAYGARTAGHARPVSAWSCAAHAERTRDTVFVVVLLCDRREHARTPDAVTPHHHGVLLALLVGVARVECFGVLRTELEDVADLDPAVDRQRVATTGARIAGRDRHDVGPHVDVEIASDD